MTAASTSFYRLAAVGLIAVGLMLSGCGRKGALDAPPGGYASTADGAPQEETAGGGGEVIRQGNVRGLPIIRGPKKDIPLDALLN